MKWWSNIWWYDEGLLLLLPYQIYKMAMIFAHVYLNLSKIRQPWLKIQNYYNNRQKQIFKNIH